jgi:NAD-dependent dihydropyrimidine dehydrogenase PreA subunit
MQREIIKIDEEKCNGCGNCIPSCPEGALQIIDGKARLVSDLMCDGLGACIGECPEGAIKIEKREAVPYNEKAVIKEIVKFGENTVVAHLKHLLDHNEMVYFETAIEYLAQEEHKLAFDVEEILDKVYKNSLAGNSVATGSCPVSSDRDGVPRDRDGVPQNRDGVPPDRDGVPSQLRHWPVQMHLINPGAPYFRDADVVLAADCVAFSVGDFHQKYLRGNSLAIACPKLDSGKEAYVEKLTAMIDDSRIKSLQVLVMEVPCCSGLAHIANLAREASTRKIPIKKTIINIKGEAIFENTI